MKNLRYPKEAKKKKAEGIVTLQFDVTAEGNSQDITVFKQNSDQGVGFMALANLAHDKATAGGIGLTI
jgi:TonB family protein